MARLHSASRRGDIPAAGGARTQFNSRPRPGRTRTLVRVVLLSGLDSGILSAAYRAIRAGLPKLAIRTVAFLYPSSSSLRGRRLHSPRDIRSRGVFFVQSRFSARRASTRAGFRPPARQHALGIRNVEQMSDLAHVVILVGVELPIRIGNAPQVLDERNAPREIEVALDC